MSKKMKCPRCGSRGTHVYEVEGGLSFKCDRCKIKLYSSASGNKILETIVLNTNMSPEEILREIEKIVTDYEEEQLWGVDKDEQN